MSANPEQMHNDEQMYSSVAMPNNIRLDKRRLPIKISKPGREQVWTRHETADPLSFSHPTVSRMVNQARDQGKANITVVTPSFVHGDLGHPCESRFGVPGTIASIWALRLIVQCQAVYRRFGRRLEGRFLDADHGQNDHCDRLA
jgi:hypothetical protein